MKQSPTIYKARILTTIHSDVLSIGTEDTEQRDVVLKFVARCLEKRK